jgi:hypothetical protein
MLAEVASGQWPGEKLMFPEVQLVQERLKPLKCPYWIAGGWAVDMFLGRETRKHKDIEIAIARADQAHLLPLPGLAGIDYVEDKERKPWRGQALSLPVHELHARFYGGNDIEVLLNEFDATDWIYRRNPAIRLPRAAFAGKPALPVEVVLLYKSRHTRPEDTQDFNAVLPRLSPEQKAWLGAAIARDVPGHPWLSLFDGAASLSGAARGKF